MSILISDSDKLIRENLTEFLSNSGYEAASVASSYQLLDAQLLQSVEVVLLDCSEKENDVLEIIQKINSLNPSVVVMVMLIEPTIKRLFRFIDNNVFDISVKPLTLNDFIENVERAMIRYQENSEFRIFQKNKDLILNTLTKQGVDLFHHQKIVETTS